MKLIAILTGKILLLIGKIFKRGSSLPGKIALKIDKKILSKLTYPKTKIVVTGSSGKGSTSTLITKVLRLQGFSVTHNTNGSNLSYGITTALIKDSTIFGKIKTDYLVLEIDERYNKEVLKYILPNYVVLTNLTKDQPPRQHYIDIVFEELKTSIPKTSTIITLMDEPLLRYLEIDFSNIIYFSLAKNKYSYSKQIFENLNNTHCPNCNILLQYDYYNFETLGKYKCPNCNFKYETPQVLGTNLNLEKETLTIDNEEVFIGGSNLYNSYNTLAAYTTLKELNISNIITSINTINKPKLEFFTKDNKEYYYFNCKSENAPTFNQALFKIKDDPQLKDIIIGWSIISKRYPYQDISWLYDISFELLNNNSINKIYVCGLNKQDLQTRLILAGIPKSKIVIKDSITDTKELILNSNSKKVYCMSHYDYDKLFYQTFKEDL